jgi:putative membrane protein
LLPRRLLTTIYDDPMHDLLTKLRSKNPGPVLTCYFSVGIAGLVIPVTREWFIRGVPLTLLLSLLLLYLYHGRITIRVVMISLLVFTAGFLLEMMGAATGLLFGEYQYGATLGLKIFHTPLLIGVNWLILVYSSSVIAGRYVDPLYFRSIVAASMMVVYDFALEPAAIRLGMWHWSGGAVPLQNYLAWFVIALVLNYLAGRLGLPNRENKVAAPLFFVQLLFFVVLDLWIVAERIWG